MNSCGRMLMHQQKTKGARTMKNIKVIERQTEQATVLRVAAYCRVSSNSADQMNSYAAQIKHYTEYIDQQPNWKLVDIYADEGLTGTKMSKRDDLMRLVNDSRKGKIDRVIVKAVSRFARNTYDSLFLTRQLKDYGTTVYFEEEKIDTGNMSDEQMLAMQSMAAQNESITISQNMRWSFKHRMESGEFVGTKAAFGYRLLNGKLEIHEEEKIVVQRIFNMFLCGTGKQTIANILNKENISHGENPWNYNAIHRILNNERYIGDALLQKTFTTEFPFRKKRNNGEKAQYYIKNNHHAVISRMDFDAVKHLQDARKTKQQRNSHTLSRKIYCTECGHTFRQMIINEILYWHCNSDASGVTNCTNARVPQDLVHQAFTIMLNKLIIHHNEILLPLLAQLERMQSRSNGSQSKIYEIDRQIAALNEQNHILAKHRSQGFIDATEFASQSGSVGNRVSVLRSERRKLLSEDENDEIIHEIKRLSDIIASIDTVQLDFNESLFAEIVTRITVVSSTELRFHLIGGLELNETITYTPRRKT